MLPKKLFCAVEAVLYIAYNSGHGPITGRDIAKRQGLPARYLEQLMQKLVRGGVLRGVRGPHGGYLLAKERRRITIGDICELLNDKDEEESDGHTATALGVMVVRPVWETAQKQTIDYLKNVNLADLCEQAFSKNIRREADEKMDFAI
jgi:Rrf2 family protein